MKNALDGVYLMPGVEFFVAVDNKGNWPNLSLLPNGEIVAAFYNHPSHGFGCGDVELWVSDDGGRLWQFRSQVSEHTDNPLHCRMNHAMGRTAEGDLLVLVSGWSEGRNLPILPVQVCISADAGRTWKRYCLETTDIPFGRIVLTPDRRLTCAMYREPAIAGVPLYVSDDGGRSWTHIRTMGSDCSETALLRCRDGKWLAAVNKNEMVLGHCHMDMYTSTDEGQTWKGPHLAPLTGCPGDLVELSDGRILLLSEQRDPDCSAIIGCVSSDQGETWSASRTFISANWSADHGYPSSVQLPDGTVVTAYYWGGRAEEGQYGGRTDLPNCLGIPWHRRYHMGVMRWRPDSVFLVPAP